MSVKRPISSAPSDGSKITVLWTDGDGVENESQGQFRDGGWWVYTDSDTQKRVQPHSWRAPGSDDEE